MVQINGGQYTLQQSEMGFQIVSRARDDIYHIDMPPELLVISINVAISTENATTCSTHTSAILQCPLQPRLLHSPKTGWYEPATVPLHGHNCRYGCVRRLWKSLAATAGRVAGSRVSLKLSKCQGKI